MFVLFTLILSAPGWAAEPVVEAVSVAPVAVDALTQYDTIRAALAEDRLDAARTAASALSAADSGLAAAAGALALAADANSARLAFSDLSKALVLRLGSTTPTPKVFAYSCPMWQGFAWWVQPKAGISNPYMGLAMPECGEEKSLKGAVKAASGAAG